MSIDWLRLWLSVALGPEALASLWSHLKGQSEKQILTAPLNPNFQGDTLLR